MADDYDNAMVLLAEVVEGIFPVGFWGRFGQ